MKRKDVRDAVETLWVIRQRMHNDSDSSVVQDLETVIVQLEAALDVEGEEIVIDLRLVGLFLKLVAQLTDLAMKVSDLTGGTAG